MHRILGILVASTAFFTLDSAAAPAQLLETLQARFPEKRFVDVRPSPIPGLYEVFTGDAIVYADESGDHLLAGVLVETRTRRDLTAAGLDERHAVDYATLPLERAITVVKGDGRRQFVVFADPDCPYCQSLERQLAAIDDVTVHTFLYPVESLHPGATARARAIWCAPDRAAGWVQWMREGKEPAAAGEGCGDDPIEANRALGLTHRVLATPTLFFPDGRRLSDTLSAAELERLLAVTPPETPAQQKVHVSRE